MLFHRELICYRCSKSGHFARDCPEEKEEREGGAREERGGGAKEERGGGAREERGGGAKAERGGGGKEERGGAGRGKGEEEKGAAKAERAPRKEPRQREYGSGGGGGLKCYKCNRFGHFARQPEILHFKTIYYERKKIISFLYNSCFPL